MTDARRAEAIARYQILDTPPEAEFDEIARMASQICGTPVSLISLLDSGRQWFKSVMGVEIRETPIELSFCSYAVETGSLMEVRDLQEDERFRGNAFVTGEPHVRFYAGAPMVTPEGVGIGTLCVLDDKPRELTEEQRGVLQSLSRHVMSLLELRRAARQLAESEAAVRDLNANLERLVEERTEELRGSEERFRDLAEHSSEVFWFVDMNPERVLYVSPAVEKVWGLPVEGFYKDARLWLKSVHPEDLPRVLAGTERVVGNEVGQFQIEYRVVHPDGAVRWIFYRGTATRDAEGRLLRVSGMAKDITERKEAEERLKFSVERMQLAAKAGRVGVWDLDTVSGRLEWNEEMYALYGLAVEKGELGLDRWVRSLHPEDRAGASAALEASLRKGSKSFNLEFRIIRERDGSTRYLRADATVYRDKDGVAIRVIGTNWDETDDRLREREMAAALSQQKELTRAAQAGERAKSEFLAVMSHEIRTPLNGILGFADLLGGVKGMPEEGRDYVATISDSGSALLRVLNDVLDFSRIEAGQMGIEKTAFVPADLVSEIGHFFAHQAREKDLDFRVVVDELVPARLNGDPGRIRQILLNLTGNAVKFTQQGAIEIGVRGCALAGGGAGLEYYVSDTGPGIPAERLGAVFEPFTQGDSSYARRHGGTGLGLAISRNLAGLMGGSLDAENGPGGGARFSLRLPIELAEGIAVPVTMAEAEVPPGVVGKILVAEDDKVNRKLIQNLIRKLGYEALMAGNGLEAVEIYKRDRPDFILMDVQMPEMDGMEATQRIREIEERGGLERAFIVALTANVMPENRRQCLEAGMNLHLTKPIRREGISEALRAAAHMRTARCA